MSHIYAKKATAVAQIFPQKNLIVHLLAVNTFLVSTSSPSSSPYQFGTSVLSSPNPLFLPTSATSSAASCLFGVIPALNGQVQYSNGQQLGPFPSGTNATAVCNSG